MSTGLVEGHIPAAWDSNWAPSIFYWTFVAWKADPSSDGSKINSGSHFNPEFLLFLFCKLLYSLETMDDWIRQHFNHFIILLFFNVRIAEMS